MTNNKCWWIAGLILRRYDLGWLILFLLYLVITLRIIFLHIPITNCEETDALELGSHRSARLQLDSVKD